MLCRSPTWVRAHAYYMHLVLDADTGVNEDTPGPSGNVEVKDRLGSSEMDAETKAKITTFLDKLSPQKSQGRKPAHDAKLSSLRRGCWAGWLKRFAVMHRMPTAGSHSTAHIPRSLQ